ncbi:putative neural-cadherin 2 [Palaemon carinicauda]|uniref:putative neural-cadherin 2 n=1 Tax=Palaemon carinicauda TaxID=392227 RepID=UPI0035B6481F
MVEMGLFQVYDHIPEFDRNMHGDLSKFFISLDSSVGTAVAGMVSSPQNHLATLAATLDYEIYDKQELEISGKARGQTVHAIVQVRVADLNDNPPTFIRQDLKVTVTEEDDRHLAVVLLKVEAEDEDELDYQGLLHTVRGDGVDGYKTSEAHFTINSLTGELIQQRIKK